jgi:hypothetical protein
MPQQMSHFVGLTFEEVVSMHSRLNSNGGSAGVILHGSV